MAISWKWASISIYLLFTEKFMKTKLLLILLCVGLILAGCRKEGCTDSAATNYDSKAKKDDGSCVFMYTCCYYDENGVKFEIAGFGCITQEMSKEDKQELEAAGNSGAALLGWTFRCEL